MSAVQPHLFGLLPEDLVAHLASVDVTCGLGEARRLLGHVISEGKAGLHLKKPVAGRVRDAVAAHTRMHRLSIVERVRDDADGFVKYLLQLDDGALVEAVRIPLLKPGCFTLCLSSQVGCAMGCTFCATGRLGLKRNLEPWEIVAQLIAVRDELQGDERITGAVFMGQGEPLHNYDNVMQAAAVLSNPTGGRISQKAISISTVGLVPQLHRYASEARPYRLIVSLTSALADKRKRLLPVAGSFALADVAAAIRAVQQASGTRQTIAWVVLGGENTGVDEVEALRALLPDVPLRINLIDVNDARDGGFRRATPEELSAFRDALQLTGQPVVRRYSGGQNKHAACGMLAATHQAPAVAEAPAERVE
jgi:23S rRNA (adenine2503-C2)-methyltransferase